MNQAGQVSVIAPKKYFSYFLSRTNTKICVRHIQMNSSQMYWDQ